MRLSCQALACILLLASAAAHAQIKRTVLQKGDVSGENREAIVAQVELSPGVKAGRHTHPGDEISYVQEGEGELLIDGEAPRKLKAGDAFIIPAGKVHDAHNSGSGTMKLVGVYVVRKGEPLAAPAK